MKPSWWKPGRGKLGRFAPLLGQWIAKAETPRGAMTCVRTYAPILSGSFIQLVADWRFDGGSYREIAFFGVDTDGTVAFWSFTTDGKHSTGRLADVSDVHPNAFGFEAEMPAGTARMIYWPEEDGTFHWAVESKSKKGWNRFVDHHYRPAEGLTRSADAPLRKRR